MSGAVSNRRPHVVVVGSINMDLVVRCRTLPRPGETLSGSSFAEIPGGKGANQAAAAARLGARVSMVGRVGDDAFGRTLRESLAGNGVDVEAVKTTPEINSGLAVIAVEDSGQNSIIVVPGANGQLTTGDVQGAADIICSADVVLLQFEVPMSVIVETIRIVRSNGNARIIVDPAPASAGDLPAEIYQADWVCPNETEAEVLCRRPVQTPDEAKDAVLWLRNAGVRNPIVTLGSQGIAWSDENGTPRIMNPFVVSAVDTTAAGDAFAGALGVALGEGLADREALRFASAAGALATTRPGAQPAMPTRDRVNELLMIQPESTGI